MCLFLTYVPWRVALRLLDCFFYDGPNVLLQGILMNGHDHNKTKAGLAILKLNEKQILEEEDSEKLMSYLRNAKYDNQVLMKVF